MTMTLDSQDIDLLRQIIREEVRAAGKVDQYLPSPLTPGQIAINMAKQGDIEGSRKYLAGLSKVRKPKQAVCL